MRVTLPYPPSANRYLRHTSRGTYRTSEADSYRTQAQLLAKAAGAKVLDCAVSVSATLHPRLTKAGKASGTRMDIDNCLKVALDALQRVAYADDSQVHRIVLEIGQPMKAGGLTLIVEPAS